MQNKLLTEEENSLLALSPANHNDYLRTEEEEEEEEEEPLSNNNNTQNQSHFAKKSLQLLEHSSHIVYEIGNDCLHVRAACVYSTFLK